MPHDNELCRLDALNNWLSDVYGKGASFNTLLLDVGFSWSEIEGIKQEHLSEFLQEIMNLLGSYINPHDRRLHIVMVQHYGLLDGEQLAFETIGHRFGVCRERIRQLVTRGLAFFRDPERQTKFQRDFAAIGRCLLDNESHMQDHGILPIIDQVR